MKTNENYYIMIWLTNEKPSYTINKAFSSFGKAANEAVKYTRENNCMFSINSPYFREWLTVNNPNTI